MERMHAILYSMIGRILGIDKGLVRRQFKCVIAHLNDRSPNRRPSILSQEQRNQLIEAISQAYATRVPWTIAHVNAYIEEHFRVHFTKQTIHELLKRDWRSFMAL
jgi:transposase